MASSVSVYASVVEVVEVVVSGCVVAETTVTVGRAKKVRASENKAGKLTKHQTSQHSRIRPQTEQDTNRTKHHIWTLDLGGGMLLGGGCETSSP